jgi:hypothetical protein
VTIPANATISDTFHRTVTPGWGTSNSGHVWSASGVGGTVAGTDSTVTSPAAHHSVPTTTAYRITYLNTVSQADLDMSATGSVTFTGGVTGGQLELLGVAFRAASLTSYYLARIEVAAGGGMTLKLIAPDAVTTVASATGIAGGISYTSAKSLTVRVQALGPWIRIKVWDPASGEPTDWDITVRDTTATAAGFVALRSGVGAGNTNTKPVVFAWTEFWVAPPPTTADNQATVEFAWGADLSADPDGWDWTDETFAVMYNPGISITCGRGDETSQAQPAQGGFNLLNTGGDFSPYRPDASNSPNVRRNTPCRITMATGLGSVVSHFGFAIGFTPDWSASKSGKLAVVKVACAGILRRITQGKTPIRSPLYDAIAAIPTLAAYWTGEEPSTATASLDQAGAGATALTPVAGTGVVMGSSTTPPGSVAAIDLTAPNARMVARLPRAGATPWQIGFAVRGTAPSVGTQRGLFVLHTSDGYVWSSSIADASVGVGSTGIGVAWTSPDGSSVGPSGGTATNALDGNWHYFEQTYAPAGPGITVHTYFDGVLVQTQSIGLGPATPTAPTDISFGNTPGFSTPATPGDLQIDHIYFATDAVAYTSTGSAVDAWTGETASARLARLCAQMNVSLNLIGDSAITMGPQPIVGFVDKLRDCETADGGLLFDGFDAGLGYVCRSARYNMPAALTIDAAAGQLASPFAPVDDDQRIRNDYTVTGAGGSVQVIEPDGPQGTDTVGIYDSSLTVNINVVSLLQPIGAWNVHLGTVDGLRYPNMALDHKAVPTLADNWFAAAGVPGGFRIDAINVADVLTQHPPDDVSLIVEGYTLVTNSKNLTIAANCSSAVPWRVAAIQDPTNPWVVAPGAAALNAGITTTAVSASIKSTDGTLLSTAGADYPRDILVDGEEITISSVTGGSSPQTAVIIRSVNGVVKSHLANTPVTLYRGAAIAL